MPDTKALEGVQVHLVETVDDCAAFLRWLSERRPILAVDTETTGLKWWTPHFLRMVQYGDGQQAWAVPHEWWPRLNHIALGRLAEDRAATVFHNLKFDFHALEAAGLPLPYKQRAHDTKVMHHLLWNERNHSLKPIGVGMFGPAASIGQNSVKRAFSEHGWWWDTIPVDYEPYWAYGAFDTILTALVAERLWPDVPDEVYEVEMAVQHLMYRVEKRGLRIDPTYTDLLRQGWVREAGVLRTELMEWGLENPSSNKMVAALLEDHGWVPEQFTPTGDPQLDKSVYAELEKMEGLPGEVAKKVVRYKRLVKWVSAYLDHFLEDRDAAGFVHPSINTMAARTGRMSITDPPLQTLPRGPEVRQCVLPHAEGQEVWSVDYDAQELRVMAHYAGATALIEAFKRGEDIHTFAASLAYGIPKEAVQPHQRQAAKNTQYSRIFGAGPAKIAATAGVPETEIKAFMAYYDERIPEISQAMDAIIQTATNRLSSEGRGYVTTGVYGRRLAAPSDRLYAHVNYLIQGTCAEVLKKKLLDLEAAGFGDYIMLPVHDEVLFSFPGGPQGDELAHDAHALLEEHSLFSVPLTCGLSGPGLNWGEAK